MFDRFVCAVVVLAATVYATPIDNGVTGDPEIECGPTSIQVTFNTQKAFSGHVYVKGLFDRNADGCRTDGTNAQAVGSISLPFDKCNVQRERSLNPKGVFVRTTVVISFHPRFVTKIDRAFTIQCFYMEADKTVSTGIEVSEITTGFQTQVVPMPVCRYEILDAASNGKPVQFAIIGQGVFHKWTCDTDTTDTFCMTVHSCFVDDGKGDRLDLITDAGCAIDKYLMNNIEYPSDLMGVKEVHVFKYADRPVLQFQCQITILVKDPNVPCARPQCTEPPGQGDGTAPNGQAVAVPSAPAKGGPAKAAPGPASNATAVAQPAPAAKGASPASPAKGGAAKGGAAKGGAAPPPPPPPPPPTGASPPAKGNSPPVAKAGAAAPANFTLREADRLPLELQQQQVQQQPSAPQESLELSRSRNRRSAMAVENHPNAAGTMDVSRSISTLDIDDHQVSAPNQQPAPHPLTVQATSLPESLSRTPLILHQQQDGICMSTAGFSTFVIMAIALIATIITVTAFLLIRNNAGGKN